MQKILAAGGLGSRRNCEELILSGRVEVGGRVVSELGAKADPEQQEIRVDGVVLSRSKLVHYVVHKPRGVVSTSRDPSGRPRVLDLLPPRGERLFTVGRLDMSSEGLILVTNDGELANRLTHPRYGIEKTYHVEVAGKLENEDLTTLRGGLYLAEGFARVVHVRIKAQYYKSTLLEIVLDEGRNREIRRLLARIGHKVLRLRRIALGPLRLGELPSGSFRPLLREELRDLRQASAPGGSKPRKAVGGRRVSRKASAAAVPAGPEKRAGARLRIVGKGSAAAKGSTVGKGATGAAGQARRPTVIGGNAAPRRRPQKAGKKPHAAAARKGRHG